MTLSNKLTFIRLLMAPVFFCLFWVTMANPLPVVKLKIYILLIVLAVFSEISDALDGRIARKRGEVTDFGKLFDPFADSVSRFTFFLCFWWSGVVPAWMIVTIFYRDACISFLRLVLRGENVVLAARISGKIKAVTQSAAIFLILVVEVTAIIFPGFPVRLPALIVMSVVVTVTVLSMVDYLWAHRHILREIDK